MLINIQDDIIRLHSAGLLSRLLADKTTGRNIMWATDAYAEHGAKYERNEQIMPELITGSNTGIIKTRARKAFEQQTERTRRRAEVFTPLWVCRKMTDYYYNDCADISEPRRYIDSQQLEITCGEAPFLVSRYDTTTGEPIPIAERIGLLDRKLRIVNETAKDEQEWLKLAKRAFESTYGYEFQGDNLLIARVNLIETFSEYMQDCWHREPTSAEMRPIINIITWNMWQMDGLNGRIPYKTADEDNVQLSFFEEEKSAPEQPPCKIFDWRARRPLEYDTMGKGNKTMKFDFVIGNPPYQQESRGANANDTPIYHYFYDAAFEISNIVELITPARFLFNAGGTPKVWNQKMLEDKHFKVIEYEADSANVFNGVDIKGGVAITYRDARKDFGSIDVFMSFNELNDIRQKVDAVSKQSLCDVITNRGIYRYSDKAYEEQPEEMQKTADRRIAPSCFERMPLLFTEDKPSDGNEYIQIYGNIKSDRFYRWFRKDYVSMVNNLFKYKVIVPKANGAGAFGETLSTPIICDPMVGFTETYISIGETDSLEEANAVLKYVKTKFLRTMLGI